MNKKIFLPLLTAIVVLAAACKKNDQSLMLDGGMINVTNAVVGGSTLTMATDQNVVSNNDQVSSNSSNIMPISSGLRSVSLFVPAVAATSTTIGKPAVNYFTGNLTVTNSSNYSLFLAGSSPVAVDTVLISEHYPYAYADSVCGVRFINLVAGSTPISVNIKGGANGSEVASLAYKAYSNFKLYPAKSKNTSITFEIREAVTGKLLYPTNGNGYPLSTPYFHNVTLCYRGIGTSVGIIVNKDY